MQKPESVLLNEMHKVLWDFEIQTDHLISTRWPDLVIINKKIIAIFCYSNGSQGKNQRKWKES